VHGVPEELQGLYDLQADMDRMLDEVPEDFGNPD